MYVLVAFLISATKYLTEAPHVDRGLFSLMVLLLWIHYAGEGLLICSCHREFAMWLIHILMDHSAPLFQRPKAISSLRPTTSSSLLPGTHHPLDNSPSQSSTVDGSYVLTLEPVDVSYLNFQWRMKYLKHLFKMNITKKIISNPTLKKP